MLQPLATFPSVGRELEGRWVHHRVVLAPWRWMLFIYRIDEDNDRVVVVTVQDAHASSAARSGTELVLRWPEPTEVVARCECSSPELRVYRGIDPDTR